MLLNVNRKDALTLQTLLKSDACRKPVKTTKDEAKSKTLHLMRDENADCVHSLVLSDCKMIVRITPELPG